MAREFRVLVANILAEVIAKLFDAEYGYPPLAEPLAADGVMILSGILNERAPLVEAAADQVIEDLGLDHDLIVHGLNAGPISAGTQSCALNRPRRQIRRIAD